MVWYFNLLKNFPQFVVIHSVKDFGVINKTKVDFFFPGIFFFFAFSMIQRILEIWFLVPLSFLSLNIWKFLVHTLLKACLENFEHYLDKSVRWVQLCGSLKILWHFLSLALEWKLTFSSPMATAEFSKFAGILSASFSQHHLFRIWRSSTGITSPPLALFEVMLSKAHLTSIPGCLALGEWSHHRGDLAHEDLFV